MESKESMESNDIELKQNVQLGIHRTITLIIELTSSLKRAHKSEDYILIHHTQCDLNRAYMVLSTYNNIETYLEKQISRKRSINPILPTSKRPKNQ